MEIKVITGLGNPGKEYEGTRHNAGFAVVDALAKKYDMEAFSRFGKSMVARGFIGSSKVLLVKPMTYMNLSGEAVREVLDYYKADARESLIVISDDINLPTGKLRIRGKGSAGGHNGLKNIILHTGTEEFVRVRVGVGAKPSPDADLAGHVLGHFAGEDKKIMEEAAERAAEAVECIVEQGWESAQNRYNGADPERNK